RVRVQFLDRESSWLLDHFSGHHPVPGHHPGRCLLLAGRCLWLAGARRGSELFVLSEDALQAAALTPLFGLHWWRNRRVSDGLPIERHVGILRLEGAAHVGIERRAADPDARRRAKPVQHTRPPLAAIGRLNQAEMLVTPFVA